MASSPLTLRGYIAEVQRALEQLDGLLLGDLLSIRNRRHVLPIAEALRSHSVDIAEFHHLIPQPFGNMVLEHLQACVALGCPRLAYDHQHTVFLALVDMSKTSSWCLQSFDVVAVDLRLLAHRLDSETEQSAGAGGGAEGTRDDLCGKLISEWRATLREFDDLGKPLAMLMIANQLIQISFKMRNFSILNTIIVNVNSNKNLGSDTISTFPSSVQVRFHFFMGRMSLFTNHNERAQERLSEALRLCPPSPVKNRRLIFIYLITINLLQGRLPSENLLRTYDLPAFFEISCAVRTGDVRLFNQGLNVHRDFFVRWGILLPVRKVRLLVYRSLFRKV